MTAALARWTLLLGCAAIAAGCGSVSPVSRGRRAEMKEADDRLLAEARREMDSGNAPAAARLYQRAIDENPGHGADVFLALASAQAASGDRAEARATARFGLGRAAEGSPVRDRLALLLVLQYAADGLHSNALDFLGSPTLDAAMAVAPLAEVLAPLAEARRHADAGRSAEALAMYSQWLASYGVPDHRLLREWSEAVLSKLEPLTAGLGAGAARELEAGDRAQAFHRFAQAVRYQTRAAFDKNVRQELLRAWAAGGEPAPAPEAIALARRGDAALHAGKLGEALRCYRRAVNEAPFRPPVRRNLALLLATAGLYDGAVEQIGWFRRLTSDAKLAAEAERLEASWVAQGTTARQADETAKAFAKGPFKARRDGARRWRAAGYTAIGLGVALAAGSATFAYLGSAQNEKIRSGGFPTALAIQEAADKGESYNALALGVGVAAGVSLAIGLPIVFTHPEPHGSLLGSTPGASLGVAVSGTLP